MHVLEMCVRMPADVSQITVHAALSKSLLYVSEYPPDPHRGFDLAATRVYALPLDDDEAAQESAWRTAPPCEAWAAAVHGNAPRWLEQVPRCSVCWRQMQLVSRARVLPS